MFEYVVATKPKITARTGGRREMTKPLWQDQAEKLLLFLLFLYLYYLY